MVEFRVDIATGQVFTQLNAGLASGGFSQLAGLTVAGEITAQTTAPPVTKRYYVISTKSSTLFGLGRGLSVRQTAAGITLDIVTY